MSSPSTAREALIAEALGDVASLIDRVEALTPAMDESRQALARANAELVHSVVGFEGRMAAITENAKTKAVEHIARRTDEVARRSLDQQTQAMTQTARALFNAEIGPALRRIVTSLQPLLERVERIERPWDLWLTHAATAAAASAATWALAVYWLAK